jgi:hypothetical protein
MNKEVKAIAADEITDHYDDHELALLYLKAGDLDRALEHAMHEYKCHLKNIDVNENVALVYYKRGEGEGSEVPGGGAE